MSRLDWPTKAFINLTRELLVPHPPRGANLLPSECESNAHNGSSARSHRHFPSDGSSLPRRSSAWPLLAIPAGYAVGGELAVALWRGAHAAVPCSTGARRDHSILQRDFPRLHSDRTGQH